MAAGQIQKPKPGDEGNDKNADNFVDLSGLIPSDAASKEVLRTAREAGRKEREREVQEKRNKQKPGGVCPCW